MFNFSTLINMKDKGTKGTIIAVIFCLSLIAIGLFTDYTLAMGGKPIPQWQIIAIGIIGIIGRLIYIMIPDKHEWYRQTTWGQKEQKNFKERNRRSKGDDSKTQYIYIQAETLFQTGKRKYVNAALQMLEKSFTDYGKTMSLVRGLDTAGQCATFLNQIKKAVHFYKLAFEREKEFTGIRSNANMHFGILVVEHNLIDELPLALKEIDKCGAPIFPIMTYVTYGVKAFGSFVNKDFNTAKQLAQRALDAAKIKDTGLSHGRGKLGTVGNKKTKFYKIVQKLAKKGCL
jgi:hypothetical protein